MAMHAHTVPRTADDLDALPADGNRYEIITSAGVDQNWIVDMEACTVEVWRPGATLVQVSAVGDALLWQPVVGVKALEINVATLFEEVQ